MNTRAEIHMGNNLNDRYIFDHVAILVPSLERSLGVLRSGKYPVEPIEVLEQQGTREVYLGQSSKGSLLLIQPTHSPWFLPHVERHGFGIHHVAIDVPSIVDFCESLENKGWFLHTASAFGMKRFQTVYLVQPASRLMIEVQLPSREVGRLEETFVNQVSVPIRTDDETKTLDHLHIEELRPSKNQDWTFRIGDREWSVNDLTR
ncbi:MAG: VOC family protein [Candidatus Ozemobacteraceae bacterium]